MLELRMTIVVSHTGAQVASANPCQRRGKVCAAERFTRWKLMDWDGSSIDCITEHGGFQSVCLDVWVLQTALYQTRQEHGRSSTSGPVHKLAYSPRLF